MPSHRKRTSIKIQVLSQAIAGALAVSSEKFDLPAIRTVLNHAESRREAIASWKVLGAGNKVELAMLKQQLLAAQQLLTGEEKLRAEVVGLRAQLEANIASQARLELEVADGITPPAREQAAIKLEAMQDAYWQALQQASDGALERLGDEDARGELRRRKPAIAA